MKELKKNICLHVLTVIYLTQPSNKKVICFGFENTNTYTILCTLDSTTANEQ